ncbi:AarF/ABC1/UbiB kinase family protein [Luteimonas sp. MC1828]|nr:AarF/ABC1/UbiB kinase family protein [Luteimonas sp. MC1828]
MSPGQCLFRHTRGAAMAPFESSRPTHARDRRLDAADASVAPMNDPSSGSLARSARILGFLMKYRRAGIFASADADPSPTAPDPAVDADADTGPETFVRDLEALGPTFIKLGQALSTRPDMVLPAYLPALERMQDEVSPIPFDAVRGVVEAELGVRLGKLFTEFDEQPLGNASIAQVHRAVMNDGREVAVKVQRPDVEAEIRRDLDILAGIAARADFVTRIGRRLHFADWVREFRKTLLAELDYRIEADNLERFGKHFEAYPLLLVPQPIWNLTTGRVLTMDLVRGTKVTALGGLRRTEHDYQPLADALVRGYLDQTFVHGEIHADPHPGNMLVTDDQRLAIFDLGMVAHVPPKQRARLLKLLFSAVDGSGEEVAEESIALGVRLEDFDEDRYVREIGQLVARYAAHGSKTMTEGWLMLELARIGADCGLRTPPELQHLGKTLLHLEGVCRALDPQLDMRQVVEGHLQQMLRERLRKSFSPASLASEAMEMQALLQDAPRRVSTLLSLLAENKMQVRLTGLQESRLTENLQKIANRVATGVIVAALIMASATLMRGDVVGPRLFGYPAIAMGMFLLASALGLGIVASALFSDHRSQDRGERGPRT